MSSINVQRIYHYKYVLNHILYRLFDSIGSLGMGKIRKFLQNISLGCEGC